MINVLYTCAAGDASGYSSSSRSYICSLNTQKNINLSVESAKFETFNTDHSKYDSVITPLLNKNIKPDVQIIHMTPENFPKYRRAGVKAIGYTTFETTKIPETWVPLCNSLDEIWVPCDWNVQVFKDSGVTVPVIKIPHATDLSQFENVEPLKLGIPKEKFIFYSIFQWTERKHPYGLLKAYLSEFSASDNVCLILKTYRLNHNASDKTLIEREIQAMKSFANAKNLPPVYLLHEAMSRQDILGLHALGDCFVLPSRGEGWSLAHMEAMGMGKPAVSTRFGGQLEFMNDDNSLLVNHTMTPVSNMPWQIYNIKQDWAEPDLSDLKAKMRYAFNNRDAAKEIGLKGKESIQKFSWEKVGAMMNSALEKTLGV